MLSPHSIRFARYSHDELQTRHYAIGAIATNEQQLINDVDRRRHRWEMRIINDTIFNINMALAYSETTIRNDNPERIIPQFCKFAAVDFTHPKRTRMEDIRVLLYAIKEHLEHDRLQPAIEIFAHFECYVVQP